MLPAMIVESSKTSMTMSYDGVIQRERRSWEKEVQNGEGQGENRWENVRGEGSEEGMRLNYTDKLQMYLIVVTIEAFCSTVYSFA